MSRTRIARPAGRRIRGLSGRAFLTVCGLAIAGFLIGGQAVVITGQIALGVIIADIAIMLLKGVTRGKYRAYQARHHPGAAGRAGRGARGAFGPCPCTRCAAARGGAGVKLVLVPDETIAAAPVQPGTGQVIVHSARGHGKSNALAMQLAAYANVTDAVIAGILAQAADGSLRPGAAQGLAQHIPHGMGLRPDGSPDQGSYLAGVLKHVTLAPGAVHLRLHASAPPPAGGAVVSGSGYTSGGAPGSQAVTSGQHVHGGGAGGSGNGSGSAGGSGAYSPGSGGAGGGGGQFASGGLVVSGSTGYHVPGSGGGGAGPRFPPRISEFDRGGQLELNPDEDSEPAFAAGSVTGYRWWTLKRPNLDLNPALAAEHWEAGLLTGVYGEWQPGVNTAVCKAEGGYRAHSPDEVPHEPCKCGYWAYWVPAQRQLGGTGTIPVFGVIKGYGKVLLGERGFRAGKARLIAACVGATVRPEYPKGGYAAGGQALDRAFSAINGGSLGGALARNPRFTGKIYHHGTATPDCDDAGYEPAYTPSRDELACAETQAEAWMAVITDRIGQMYPGVKVYETPQAMTAMHPATPEYAPGYSTCATCGTARQPAHETGCDCGHCRYCRVHPLA